MVALVRHRQTKGSATDRFHLNHRATPRLHTSPVLGLHISGMRVNQDLPRRCTASSVSSWIGTYIALELKSKPLCPSGTEGWLRSCPLGSTQFVDDRWRHESRAAPAC